MCVGQCSLWGLENLGFVVEIKDADLLFNCSVDKVSEAQILNEVVGLNYLVDNLFFGTTVAALDPHARKESRDWLRAQIDIDVLNIITKKPLSADLARIFIAELILKPAINTIIHRVFFKGGLFYGVRSDSLRRNLERMKDKLSELYLYVFFFYFNHVIILFFIFYFYLGIWMDGWCSRFKFWCGGMGEQVLKLCVDWTALNTWWSPPLLAFEKKIITRDIHISYLINCS